MGDKTPDEIVGTVPRKQLPSFRRVLKPQSQEYESRELGELPKLAKPKLRPAQPLSTPASRSIGSESNEEPDMSDMFAKLSISGKFASAADLADSTTTNVLPSYNSDKVAQLSNRRVHQKAKFKQIINKTESNQKDITIKAIVDSELVGGEEIEEAVLEKLGKDPASVPGLIPKLLPHQVVGLKFLMTREHGRKYARGGILADEMGLGKTIQTIALLLSEPPPGNIPDRDGQRASLIICPVSILNQWKSEIHEKAPTLRVLMHYDRPRAAKPSEFSEYDVVLTTYRTVLSELNATHSPLHRTEWYRIIADEAHTFRNPSSKTTEAIMSLKATHSRWALTGTPMHNRLEDLTTLLNFVGVQFPRTADNSKVVAFTGKESNIDASYLSPILKTIMLRRTQKVLSGILPPLVMTKQGIHLTAPEEEKYRSFKGPSSSYTFQDLVRLRLACDGIASESGYKVAVPGEGTSLSSAESASSSVPSPSSSPSKSRRDRFNGADIFGLTGAIDEDDFLAAKLGGMAISENSNKDKEKINGDKEAYWGANNSKVQAMREIMLKNKMRKTVVFSSFVTMLEALQPMLRHEGISSSIFSGSLNASQRESVIKRFSDDKHNKLTVLLCSLQAAAVGLNLTCADQVVVMEPWWNPQIVDQAIKRVHRLGQTRPVTCIELFVKGLLEDRIMQIQGQKRNLAKQVLDDPTAQNLTREETEFIMHGEDEFRHEALKPTDIALKTTSSQGRNALNDKKKEQSSTRHGEDEFRRKARKATDKASKTTDSQGPNALNDKKKEQSSTSRKESNASVSNGTDGKPSTSSDSAKHASAKSDAKAASSSKTPVRTHIKFVE